MSDTRADIIFFKVYNNKKTFLRYEGDLHEKNRIQLYFQFLNTNCTIMCKLAMSFSI